MELNHLRYFYEVAKAGSFTEAARILRISQSALSKAVALLEDSEGVKLFERSKRGVTLTPVGTDVFRMSSGIFHTVSEIQNTCRGKKEVCEGFLRFGASDHVTNYLLPKKMHQMRTEHPKVIPSVFAGTPHEIVSMILEDKLEFGLFFTRINTAGIAYETVTTLPMAVVCHPKHVGKGALTPAKLKSLVKEIGFIGSIKNQYQHHPSEELMKLLGKDIPVACESNSQESQKRYCMEGGGIAFLARFMVEKELREGTLVEAPTSKPLALHLLLAKRKNLPLSITSRTFLELVQATLTSPA